MMKKLNKKWKIGLSVAGATAVAVAVGVSTVACGSPAKVTNQQIANDLANAFTNGVNMAKYKPGTTTSTDTPTSSTQMTSLSANISTFISKTNSSNSQSSDSKASGSDSKSGKTSGNTGDKKGGLSEYAILDSNQTSVNLAAPNTPNPTSSGSELVAALAQFANQFKTNQPTSTFSIATKDLNIISGGQLGIDWATAIFDPEDGIIYAQLMWGTAVADQYTTISGFNTKGVTVTTLQSYTPGIQIVNNVAMDLSSKPVAISGVSGDAPTTSSFATNTTTNTAANSALDTAIGKLPVWSKLTTTYSLQTSDFSVSPAISNVNTTTGTVTSQIILSDNGGKTLYTSIINVNFSGFQTTTSGNN